MPRAQFATDTFLISLPEGVEARKRHIHLCTSVLDDTDNTDNQAEIERRVHRCIVLDDCANLPNDFTTWPEFNTESRTYDCNGDMAQRFPLLGFPSKRTCSKCHYNGELSLPCSDHEEAVPPQSRHTFHFLLSLAVSQNHALIRDAIQRRDGYWNEKALNQVLKIKFGIVSELITIVGGRGKGAKLITLLPNVDITVYTPTKNGTLRIISPDETAKMYRWCFGRQRPTKEPLSREKKPDTKLPPNNLPTTLGYVVERREKLDEIAKEFSTSRIVCITGLPATGKTWLARHYAREAKGKYPGGIWNVNAKRGPVDAMIQLQPVLLADAPPDVRECLQRVQQSHSDQGLADAVRISLEKAQHASLLILDGVDCSEWTDYLPRGNVCILQTTIDTRYSLVKDPIHLGVFTSDESQTLCDHVVPKTSKSEEASRDRVIDNLLGHYPLAVALAAAAVSSDSLELTWQEYESELRKNPHLIDALAPQIDYRNCLFAAIDISLDRCFTDRYGCLLLIGMASFAQSPIPFEWIAVAAGLTNEIDRKLSLLTPRCLRIAYTAGGKQPWQDWDSAFNLMGALAARAFRKTYAAHPEDIEDRSRHNSAQNGGNLKGYSRHEYYLETHSLVHERIRERVADQFKQQLIEAQHKLISHLATHFTPHQVQLSQDILLLLEMAKRVDAEADWLRIPEVQGWFIKERFSRKIDLTERTLQVAKQVFEPNDPHQAIYLYRHGKALSRVHRMDAVPFLSDALSLCQSPHPVAQTLASDIHKTLARLYSKNPHALVEARHHYQQVLLGAERIGTTEASTEHRSLLVELAGIVATCEDFSELRTLLEAIVNIDLIALERGNWIPNVRLLTNMLPYSEAMPLLEQANEITKHDIADADKQNPLDELLLPNVEHRLDLAELLIEMGKDSEALEIVKQASVITQNVDNKLQIGLSLAWFRIYKVFIELGQFKEAEDIIGALEADYGDCHLDADSDFLLHRIYVYFGLNARENALSALQSALELTQGTWDMMTSVTFLRGAIQSVPLSEEGCCRIAIEQSNRLLEMARELHLPHTDVVTRTYLSIALYARGLREDAIVEARKILERSDAMPREARQMLIREWTSLAIKFGRRHPDKRNDLSQLRASLISTQWNDESLETILADLHEKLVASGMDDCIFDECFQEALRECNNNVDA